MSIPTIVKNYTPLIQPLQQKMSEWLDNFSIPAASTKPLELRLSGQQLALLLQFPLFQNNPHQLVISDLPGKKLQNFVQTTKGWQEFFPANTFTFQIAGTLSDPEIEGVITTDLSLAWHTILSTVTAKENKSLRVITSSDEVNQLIPDPKEYSKKITVLHRGENMNRTDLITRLTKNGYIRHTTTLDKGSVRIRGEQVDISHPLWSGHYTITFFGNQIEQIVYQDKQRSQTVDQIKIWPMALPTPSVTWQSVMEQFVIFKPSHVDLQNSQTIVSDSLTPVSAFPFTTYQVQPTEKPVVVLYENYDHVAAYAKEHFPEATLIPSALSKQDINLASDTLVILSETKLFGKVSPTSFALPRDRAFELIGQLTPGKPAVHSHHGIGIYEGLQHREIGGVEREYLVLRYADGDSVSVPVEYAHKVTPYIGESAPKVHRLQGGIWAKTKRKAQEDAAEFAKELLSIAQERSGHERPAYVMNDSVEEQIEESFPFTLTADQNQTWEEIKHDLEQPVPMDRVVVGDVGFGKTEIALRTAAQIASQGKQVAVLAPTTLLTQQHADTFISRLQPLGFSVGALSRAITPAAKKKLLTDISSGEAQVVIGTHAILSKHINWKNLGLIIIDEEQRFGVKQKEHFKKLRSTIDMLSLSATPIPRTLSMALSGLRELSLITTAPTDRKDIITTVKPDSGAIVEEGIKRELERGGQVYVVAPKIRQLGSIQHRLSKMFPAATSAVAHGQMAPEMLEAIMHQFHEGDVQILISSTIIENGLDLPNANTIIVFSSTHFGLSDLYQLRGRIGRRSRQGYAYFLYNQTHLSSIQKQRLTAITQASRLGSGWTLAQRDLEIRGAGNFLGREQSGTVAAVGVQFYLSLVEQAVSEQKGEITKSIDTDVLLPISAFIPPHYIHDLQTRTRWYQRLSRARNIKGLEGTMGELEKSYGPVPEETKNLFQIIRLQIVASQNGITKISSRVISPNDEPPYARLEITASNLPVTLSKLAALGNWVVRQNMATWDIDEINPELVKKVITVLEK